MNERIVESRPPIILRIIGIAIMLGGLRFLWKYFFTDLIATVKDPDFFPSGLPGMLFILVIGLALTAGGALAAFLTKRTIFDSMQRTVTTERGLWLYKKRGVRRFDDFTRVLSLWHSSGNSTGSTSLYDVDLLDRDGRHVNIDVFTKDAQAAELAKSLAQLMQLPVTDTSRDEWMARDDDDEDLPETREEE